MFRVGWHALCSNRDPTGGGAGKSESLCPEDPRSKQEQVEGGFNAHSQHSLGKLGHG